MKKPKSRKKKVIEAILTVLGTAVVAVTFYVHEIKREDAKAADDRIEHALEKKELKNLFTDLQFRIDGDTKPTPKDPKEISYLTEMQGDLQLLAVVKSKILENNAILDSSGMIVDSLDNNAVFKTRIQDWVKRYTLLEEKRADAESKITMYLLRNAKPSEKAAGQSADLAANVYADLLALAKDGSELQNDIFEEAKNESAAAQSSFKRATSESHFLYPFGFLLAFVGKLIGIEIDDGDD